MEEEEKQIKKKGKGANVLSDISRGRVVELSDGCESHYCL